MPSVHLNVEELESRTLLTQYNLVILGGGASVVRGINQNGDAVGIDLSRAAEWDAAGNETILNVRSPSEADGINDNGQIVGEQAYIGSSDFHPFRCQNLVCIPLTPLPGDSWGIAWAINESGQAVGFSTQGIARPIHAVLWDNGQPTALLDGEGDAHGINDAGFVVGSSSEGAFAWKHGQHALLSAPGYAIAVNNQFQIIGSGAGRAWLWSAGEVIDLPLSSSGINNAGDIVGDNSAGPQIYQNGKISRLQDLLVDNQGCTLRTAAAINDAGQIVGSAACPTGGGSYRLDPVGDAPAWMGWALGLEKKDHRG